MQEFIETFSRKNIDSIIGLEMESIKDELLEMEDKINDYLIKGEMNSYYESKNQRIKGITHSGKEIANYIALISLGRRIPIQEAIGKLLHKLFDGISKDNLTTTAELFGVVKDIIYSVERKMHEVYLVPLFELEEDIVEYLNDLMYLPPMMEKPIEWNSNTGGGLKTIKEHLILGSTNNKHYKYQAYDVVNILQDIKWRLDVDTVDTKEEPNKILDGEALDQFINHSKQSSKLYNRYKYTDFYFMWKYDKRGRIYSSGYHINLQSTSYKKASLNFAKKELIEGTL